MIDGLLFGIDSHYKLLQLQMPCHGCGVVTAYRSITGKLLELGRLLSQYEKREENCLCKECLESRYEEIADQMRQDPAPSTEQQVIIWLTALIRREIAAMAPA